MAKDAIGSGGNGTRSPSEKGIRPRRTAAEKLAQIDENLRALQAERAALEAKARDEARKREAREKAIVGAAVLNHADHDAQFRAALRVALDRTVKRPKDRQDIADLMARLEKPAGAPPPPERPETSQSRAGPDSSAGEA